MLHYCTVIIFHGVTGSLDWEPHEISQRLTRWIVNRDDEVFLIVS